MTPRAISPRAISPESVQGQGRRESLLSPPGHSRPGLLPPPSPGPQEQPRDIQNLYTILGVVAVVEAALSLAFKVLILRNFVVGGSDLHDKLS